jgi:long-chain acyl-CoA synthetase
LIGGLNTVTDWIAATAASRPEALAVIEGDPAGETRRTVRYAEILAAVERGRRLAHRITPGDRCGLSGANDADFILRGLEIMAAGACFFPIAHSVQGATLDHLARRVKLHHLVLDGVWHHRHEPGDVDGQGDAHFRSLEPAYIRFTSGTTSTNKGVLLSRQALIDRIRAANQGLGIGPDDRILWLLPMAHHWVVSILLYLAHGACILIPAEGANAARALATRARATVIYAGPHDYALLADGAPPGGWPGLRRAFSTASGLTASIAAAAQTALGIPLTQALGVIEAGLPAINLAAAAEKPLSVGRPLPGYDLWLRDEDGRRIAGTGPENAGEVCIRGPGLYSAYLDPWRPATADFFATGDQGWFDSAGDLFILGRRHNRIHSGGMKFFAEEVEAAIERHPAVRASRVLAEPHPRLGEVPVAEIEIHPGATAPDPSTWRAFLADALPPHMIPVAFTVVEALPRTPTGKIRRW